MSAFDKQVGGDHYKGYKIQPTEFCQVNKLPWCESNIIKYACRWREKGGLQDLEKIKHYVDLLITIEGITRWCGNGQTTGQGQRGPARERTPR